MLEQLVGKTIEHVYTVHGADGTGPVSILFRFNGGCTFSCTASTLTLTIPPPHGSTLTVITPVARRRNRPRVPTKKKVTPVPKKLRYIRTVKEETK